MKKDTQTKVFFIINIIMLMMVFYIAKHYRDEVLELKKEIKKLEILIEKYGRNDSNV